MGDLPKTSLNIFLHWGSTSLTLGLWPSKSIADSIHVRDQIRPHKRIATLHTGFILSRRCRCREVFLPACCEGSLVGLVLHQQNLLHLSMEVPKGSRVLTPCKIPSELVKGPVSKLIPKKKNKNRICLTQGPLNTSLRGSNDIFHGKHASTIIALCS